VSTFSGLNTATTALWAQQRGLDVTGQNIANVNTAGYTRQRAELQSVGGNAVPATYAVSNQVGQGVDADKVIRIRDAFLQGRSQVEGATTAYMTVQDDTLAQIEQAFREPGDTGIQAKLTAVFTAWSDVANHPTEDGARAAVLQKTAALVAQMHTTSSNLTKQWTQTRDSLDVLGQDVNAKAASIAELNTAIKRATSTPRDDGQVDVVVSGATLISGGTASALRVVGTLEPADAAPGNPAFVTDPGGTRLNLGGTAGGQLNALTSVLPDYQAQLNGVAQQLAEQFNTAHTRGFDPSGGPGQPMFAGGPDSETVDGAGVVTVDTSKITAANLRLRLTSSDQLAAASIGGQASSDAGNAAALSGLQSSAGGPAAGYRTMIVALGVQASVATSNLQTQTVISSQVDAANESVSGVNLDEEMTNMLQFQHAYSAAARMITTIDETLDVLINRTGRVGL
jgi:flagellar hook-associated protein 1 FlgK